MIKRTLPLVLCLVMLFTCIPMGTSYASRSDLPSINKVLDKLTSVVHKVATSEDERVRVWYNRIKYTAQGANDPELGFKWTTDKLVDQLRGEMQTAGEKELNKYLPDEISVDEADKLVGLFKLMDLYTKSERLSIINEMSTNDTPEILKAETDLLDKLRKKCPELEDTLKKFNSHFNLEVYTYVLLKIQPKLDKPALSEDKDGNLTINLPGEINGVKVIEVVDTALKGLSAYGYSYTSIDDLSKSFIKAFNNELSKTTQVNAKDLLFQYGLFKSEVKKDVDVVVEDDKVKDGKATVEVSDAKVDKFGMTAPITVNVAVTEKMSAELGLPKGTKIAIKLPELEVGKGKQLEVIIEKTTKPLNGRVALALEIGAKGVDHIEKVTLSLPVPAGIDNSKAMAFHWEEGTNTWEVRKGAFVGGVYVFDTNLSPVAIAEEVEIPVLKSTEKTTSSVSLQWTSSLEGASYAVYKNGSKMTTTTDKAYKVTGLNDNTTFKFKVKAIDADGFESDMSNELSVKTNKASTSSGGGGGGGGGSYSGTTVKANQADQVSRKDAIVKIPANAFDKDMKVKIDTVYPIDKLPMAEGMKFAGKVYEITKSEKGNFKKNVTIILPYDKSKVDLEKEELALYWLDETKKEWKILDNIKVDTNDEKVSGEVNHFTKFAVIAKTIEMPVIPVKPMELPKDIKGHWAAANIEKLIKLGAISGYPDNTFKPDAQITRAEFATVLVKAFDLKSDSSAMFTDTQNHWAKDFINAASIHGIVSGYDEFTFGPDDLITREQMAVMIVKAAAVKSENGKLMFTDSKEIASWAKEYVISAVDNAIVGGYPDNTFKPKANATRAEAVTIIVNALK